MFFTEKARTDLAVEARNELMERYSKTHEGEIDGIKYSESTKGKANISVIDVINDNGAEKLGRKKGKYITVSFPDIMNISYSDFTELCDICAMELKNVCLGVAKEINSVFVCGLGNDRMTPDAVGPEAVKNVIITRHLKEKDRALFDATGLFDICALCPGVSAVTGLDAANTIRSVAQGIRPDVIIVIDALAARESARLCRTLQICSSGISPGSGVGNAKSSIDRESMGFPVVAVGIPTVVDTGTIIGEALGDTESCVNGGGLFVCPKDIDELCAKLSRLTGYAINRAFHGELSFGEMTMM
ncbi:MAG: GPR endopeptidase [Eubacteriales bacterium]